MTHPTDAALQPLLDFLSRGGCRRGRGGKGRVKARADKGGPDGSGAGGVRCVDIGLAATEQTTRLSPSDVAVVRLVGQESTSPASKEMLGTIRALCTRKVGKRRWRPAAVCILASHTAIMASAEWCAVLGTAEQFLYIVVPLDAEGDVSWYCGGFRDARIIKGGERALIDAAVKAKAKGEPFPKIARTWERLGELTAGGAAGGGASRMAHLFSRTDPVIRAKLRLDATATFSVTDEVTADQITSKCLELPHVLPSPPAVVDLTACVGGNTLSFAKQFSSVVAVELDTGRCGMLRHNVALVLADRAGDVEVTVVEGDAVELLRSRAWPPRALYFLDPPWGGLNYKDKGETILELGGQPIERVVGMCLSVPGCVHVVIKVPFNVHMGGFHALSAHISTWSLSKKVKCIVVSPTSITPSSAKPTLSPTQPTLARSLSASAPPPPPPSGTTSTSLAGGHHSANKTKTKTTHGIKRGRRGGKEGEDPMKKGTTTKKKTKKMTKEAGKEGKEKAQPSPMELHLRSLGVTLVNE